MQAIIRIERALRLPPQLGAAALISLQQLAPFAKEATTKEAKQQTGDVGGDGKVAGMLLKALEPQEVEEIDLSPEDLAEAETRAKEYSRRQMQQHRAWQLDLTTKLQLKQAAIAALPEELQTAALVPDLTPFPLNRQIWTETPPPDEAEAKAQTQQTGRRRTIGTKRR